MVAARRKWTRALLRQALEDENLFEELRLSFLDGTTEAEIRARVQYELSWHLQEPGEPYSCSYCDRRVDERDGEVAVRARPDRLDRARYRAVCRLCREERDGRSDAGWES